MTVFLIFLGLFIGLLLGILIYAWTKGKGYPTGKAKDYRRDAEKSLGMHSSSSIWEEIMPKYKIKRINLQLPVSA